MIWPPALPTASLEPVCSGCQWVLISVATRLVLVALSTALSSSSEFTARPPSIISAPSGPGRATTLQPLPEISDSPATSLTTMSFAATRTLAALLAGGNGLRIAGRHGAEQRSNRQGLRTVAQEMST